jgi:hypothetical protein
MMPVAIGPFPRGAGVPIVTSTSGKSQLQLSRQQR